jgi:hypothetical protein
VYRVLCLVARHAAPVIGLAILSLVAGLAVTAPASADGLPAVAGLSSSTHPDPARWYASSYPAFFWRPAIGAAGYSWWLDRTPTTVPDAMAEVSGLSFAPHVDFAVGSYAISTVTGDFNGDGAPDVATANVGAGTVSVLLGVGDGTLAPRVDYATGAGPICVAVGDFDGDGKQDLATADSDANSVSVLLGNGDGTFRARSAYPAGNYTVAVAVGDFDKDGNMDLVVANGLDGTVGLLLGDGDGGFAAQTTFAAGAQSYSVAVGDLNGDGRQDLVAACIADDCVAVLLNTGAATFAPKVIYTTGSRPFSPVLRDLDGDGKLDLAVASMGTDSVDVLLGNGDGTFGAATDFATGVNPHGVAVADVDLDGTPDLAVSNLSSSGGVSVLCGRGDGTFAPKVDCSTGTGVSAAAVASADFDADGRQDLVVAGGTADTLAVLLNRTPDSVAGFGHRADGTWYFHVRAVDGVGGAGAASHVAVNIDTTAPTTRGLAEASVVRGRTVKLRYQVDDARPGSPTARVTIRIRNGRGTTVKTLRPGVTTVNTPHVTAFTCTLPKGTYRFFVYATDAAGNAQRVVGSSRLTVR